MRLRAGRFQDDGCASRFVGTWLLKMKHCQDQLTLLLSEEEEFKCSQYSFVCIETEWGKQWIRIPNIQTHQMNEQLSKSKRREQIIDPTRAK